MLPSGCECVLADVCGCCLRVVEASACDTKILVSTTLDMLVSGSLNGAFRLRASQSQRMEASVVKNLSNNIV